MCIEYHVILPPLFQYISEILLHFVTTTDISWKKIFHPYRLEAASSPYLQKIPTGGDDGEIRP